MNQNNVGRGTMLVPALVIVTKSPGQFIKPEMNYPDHIMYRFRFEYIIFQGYRRL